MGRMEGDQVRLRAAAAPAATGVDQRPLRRRSGCVVEGAVAKCDEERSGSGVTTLLLCELVDLTAVEAGQPKGAVGEVARGPVDAVVDA